MSSERPILTPEDVDILVEAARLFMDPKTGEVPRVTVKAWSLDLEVERPQSSRAPKAARR